MTKSKIFRIVKIISVALVILFVLTFTLKLINKEAYIILSGSMEPEISVGDIVVTKNIKENELAIGDVISFRSGSMVVTHRITNINKNGNDIEYTTKGDNNNTEDIGTITYKDIIGKYSYKIPKIGHAMLFIKQNFLIVIAIIILLIIFIILSPKKREE